MPRCPKCTKFVDGVCTSRPWGDSPVNQLRGCSVAAYEYFLSNLNTGMNILEIGVGDWSFCRDFCRQSGIHWHGIDILSDSLASVSASVEHIPFKDDSFDAVVGNQSIEHWKENGCRLELGIYECLRVCKTGGEIYFTAPVHFHGSSEFVRGRLDQIANLFGKFSGEVQIEAWGNGVHLLDYSPLRDQPAFNLSIRARKTRELTNPPTPYYIKRRIIRELFDHSLLYIAWKVKNRIIK
jgi:SAM-dependent methyltransferase